MKNTYFAFALLLSILCPAISRASHAQGADLAYKFVSYDSVAGTTQYYVTATEYRDCTGIPADPNMVVNLTNQYCGGSYSQNFTLNMVNGLPCPNGGTSTSANGCEVSHLCNFGQSTCSGGNYPGMQKYTYGGTITLPATACSQWIVSISISARNPSSNISAAGNLYIEAVINNTLNPSTGSPYINSSPEFQNDPVPFACVSTAGILEYNNAGVDADGDSLVYSLVTPLQGHSNPLVFNAGYTRTNPIISSIPCSLDPSSGILQYRPSQTDVDVLSFLVEEYRHGVLVGSTRRDVELKILNCNEVPPIFAPVVAVQGAVIVDSVSVTGCLGDDLIIDVPVTAVNASNLVLQSSIVQFPASYSGMTFTQVGTGSSATARIEWQAIDTMCRYVYIKAISNDCPVEAYSYDMIRICPAPKVHITPQSATYCGQPVTLSGSGGVNPIWTPTTGISNPGTLVTTVYPTVATWYHLTSSCGSDSVLVGVGTPIYGSISHDTSVCNGTPVQIQETVSTTGQYTYAWTPAAGLYDPITGLPDASIPNPVVRNNLSTVYHCLVSDTSGCFINDSVRVNVNGNGRLIVTGDSLVATGGVANLSATAVSYTAQCTTVPGNIVPTQSQVQVGTGTAVQGGSAMAYPSPFGNYYKSARHQILYKASELQALFGSSRVITQFALEIGTSNSTSTLNNFTVKIGCVHADSLTGYVGTGGLQTVYTHSFTPVGGWNTLVLDNAYVWDGVSDLVVDMCFLNHTSNNINNKMRYSPTSFRSIWCTYGNDTLGQCGYTGVQQNVVPAYATFFQRPNTKFGLGSIGSGTGSIQWQPSTGVNAVSNPNAANTTAHVYTDQWYTVTSSASLCPSSDSVLVRVTGNPTHTPFNSYLCLGDSMLIEAFGAATYAWSDASGLLSTNSSFYYAPTQNADIYLVMTDGTGNTVRDTSHVTVLDQRVWPGDANSDGIVDYSDLLYVGMAFGDTGSVRPNASLVWSEQCALSWDSSFAAGPNCVYADCDGDGVVGYSDTLAAVTNLGQTHPKTAGGRSSNYNLTITTDKGIYSVGDTIIAHIYAGDAGSPISAIYGLAYAFDYSSHGATHIISADQSMSWINRKLDHRKQTSSLTEYLVQSRTNHKDTTGHGQIAEIRLLVDGAISIVDSGSLTATTLLAMTKNGDTVNLNAATKAVAINGIVGINTIRMDQAIEIYPNPNKGVFTVTQNNAGKADMTVMDAIGRQVYSRILSDKVTNLDLSMMPDGVYLISISTAGGKTTKRLIIEK